METRITELEIKLAHAETEIEALNKTVFLQHKQLEELTNLVDILNDYVKNISKQMSQITPPGEEPPPPHY